LTKKYIVLGRSALRNS